MKNKLDLKQLVWIGTGHVIGAGVVSIVGSAIASTGYSVWLAFLIACILSFIRILPVIFFTSAVTVDGGYYGMITRCSGMKYGGLISLSSILNWSARGTAVLALSQYISEFLPFINSKAFTIMLWGFFCIANLFGLNVMSKIQSIATPILLISLTIFSILGIVNMQSGYLDFSSNYMFRGGKSGFFTAVVLLSYSCDGVASLSNYSTQCKNSKKTVPLSMIIVSIIITFIYVAVGFASAAVLPLNETANNTLIITAKSIMTPFVFNLFVIFGPIFALLTTMNAGIMNSALPAIAGAKEGWLPKFISSQNRYGAYHISIIIIFIIGSLPVIFNFSISQIASITMALGALSAILMIISSVNFPFVFKSEWQKSWLNIPTPFYFLIIFICAIIELFVVIKSLCELTITMRIINILVLIVCSILGFKKSKSINYK